MKIFTHKGGEKAVKEETEAGIWKNRVLNILKKLRREAAAFLSKEDEERL